MALKPRKQRKHYPYLFLLNETTFLKYLKGQHIEYLNYSGCSYSDSDSYQEGFIFSKTKLIIFSQSYRFSYIERLLDSLTEDGKLEYAPIFCSSWIVKNDSEAIKKMKISIANNRVYYSKTKEKREARKELRLNSWCCGWMDFELNKSIEDLELDHTMLSHRERKWWQKGYDDAKEDIDQFTLNIEQMMSIHEQGCDAYRAGINENPYKHKLKSKCWREGWESIMAFEAYCAINYK